MPLLICASLTVPDDAISLRFIRSSGPGGQNVNKVASAVQLRFDARACPQLSFAAQARLKTLAGRRMTEDGVVVITAQRLRTQEQNKRDAYERLSELLRQSLIVPKTRRATKPTRASKERRLEHKQQQGTRKRLRGRPSDAD